MTADWGPGLAGLRTRALGLMYTSLERFTSVSAEVSIWSDLDVWESAQEAWREHRRSMGTLIVPMGGGGSQRKPSGRVSDTAQYRYIKESPRELGYPVLDYGGRNGGEPGVGTLVFDEMLQPIGLLTDSAFTVTGTRRVAGRQGIELRAVRRRQWHECSDPRLWEGPDEFYLVVDAERGILLSATSLFQGNPIAGKECVSVSFGEPLPDLGDRWDAVGEVVGLLYSAQHNFATVRATVREGTPGRMTQIVAAHPPRFRVRSIRDDGQPGGLTVYDGAVWWGYSPARREASTNTPKASLPAEIPENKVAYKPHPITPGDAVYQILDAEYAITESRALNPSCLLSYWWLEPAGRTALAGREVIRVRGESNDTYGESHWWEGVEECELLVDAERGMLLRLAGMVDGQEVVRHEVTEIEFDGPVDDAEFRFTPPPGVSVGVAWYADRQPPPPPKLRDLLRYLRPGNR